MRWPDAAMPLKVYVAPFTWYEQSKQRESGGYRQMVLQSLDAWVGATGGRFRYQLVNNVHDSNIDLSWRRVDRSSLGHCEYLVNDKSIIYSAEISIGISDGVLHAQYNDVGEVQHTILHEIGHALGLLGHSDGQGDIMYVPHQFGVTALSARDKTTIETLYQLPVGFDYRLAAQDLKMEHTISLYSVLDRLAGKTSAPAGKKAKPKAPPKEKKVVLDTHHDILTHMGKFHMATQNIRVPSKPVAKPKPTAGKPPPNN